VTIILGDDSLNKDIFPKRTRCQKSVLFPQSQNFLGRCDDRVRQHVHITCKNTGAISFRRHMLQLLMVNNNDDIDFNSNKNNNSDNDDINNSSNHNFHSYFLNCYFFQLFCMIKFFFNSTF
jgi:hypothetical protein